MLPEIEQLLVLQDCDRKIRTLKIELKVAPEERKDVEERLVANAAHLESQKQLAKNLEVEKKKLEVDAQAKRDQIGKFRGQQFQTRKNEEFQALGNEIKHAEADIQSIEDRELDIMDQIEKQRVANIATEQESAKAKSQLNQQLADIDAKTKALADQLAGLEADRAKLTAGIDEDLLSRYERLFASKGDLAVVPLEHEVCMGCHMKITTQTSVRVKAGKEIESCEQCGRILYHAA
ncbi:MAG TPA: C4-type zinc ribbon domain-containing protein [Chthoniobacteraceae bacterium]|nr:C4-type zinc ribbon domain-containing protein [Chthoniobacteraceae bacterium]